MSQELTTLEEAAQRAERKAIRLRNRETKLNSLVVDIIEKSARDVSLRNYAFQSDEQLTAAGLTPEQITKVRAWEAPKKDSPFALEAANNHVTAFIRRQQDRQGIKINIENATLKLPEKRASDMPAVIIDVEATEK